MNILSITHPPPDLPLEGGGGIFDFPPLQGRLRAILPPLQGKLRAIPLPLKGMVGVGMGLGFGLDFLRSRQSLLKDISPM